MYYTVNGWIFPVLPRRLLAGWRYKGREFVGVDFRLNQDDAAVEIKREGIQHHRQARPLVVREGDAKV